MAVRLSFLLCCFLHTFLLRFPRFFFRLLLFFTPMILLLYISHLPSPLLLLDYYSTFLLFGPHVFGFGFDFWSWFWSWFWFWFWFGVFHLLLSLF